MNQRGLPAANRSRDTNSKSAMSVIVAHSLEKKIALRQRQNAGRFASEKLAVRANFVSFRIHFDVGRGGIMDHVGLSDFPAILHRHQALAEAELLHVRKRCE